MKPILFNTDMVRAILDGRKTVTRRVVKPHFRPGETGWQVITEKHSGKYVRIEYLDEWENETRYMSEPFRPGDILYVRETWCDPSGTGWPYIYKADLPMHWDGEETENGLPVDLREEDFIWRPSIHMPKDAARIFLRVTDVRVERLREISALSAMDEGVTDWNDFVKLWNSTIKHADLPLYGWSANPWVWVIEFERISRDAALKGGDDHA